jgi:hypothetical protein
LLSALRHPAPLGKLKIATKTRSNKEIINKKKLGVFVSWWQKYVLTSETCIFSSVFRRSDMDFGPQQIGRWLIWLGILISLLGGLMLLLGRVGLFRLPGDLEFGSKNWRFYFPIASCILISIVLTLILWLISYFRR